jgi:hypothetical protein
MSLFVQFGANDSEQRAGRAFGLTIDALHILSVNDHAMGFHAAGLYWRELTHPRAWKTVTKGTSTPREDLHLPDLQGFT